MSRCTKNAIYLSRQQFLNLVVILAKMIYSKTSLRQTSTVQSNFVPLREASKSGNRARKMWEEQAETTWYFADEVLSRVLNKFSLFNGGQLIFQSLLSIFQCHFGLFCTATFTHSQFKFQLPFLSLPCLIQLFLLLMYRYNLHKVSLLVAYFGSC